MARATTLLAVTTALGVATSAYLYLDNRSLRADMSARSRPDSEKPLAGGAATGSASDAAGSARSAKIPGAATSAPAVPTLPEEPKESRLERRQRRQEEFAAQFGRLDGETAEEYRQRVMPLISAGLVVPRMRMAEMRKTAEEKAGVTPEQSKQLDTMFEKTYGDVLDYTNKAVADGQLSPYERNVAGWLDFAGGLGGVLGDTQGQIGKVLTPAQVRAMSDSGFEWAEYLGAQAPWERLDAPPPRP